MISRDLLLKIHQNMQTQIKIKEDDYLLKNQQFLIDYKQKTSIDLLRKLAEVLLILIFLLLIIISAFFLNFYHEQLLVIHFCNFFCTIYFFYFEPSHFLGDFMSVDNCKAE